MMHTLYHAVVSDKIFDVLNALEDRKSADRSDKKSGGAVKGTALKIKLVTINFFQELSPALTLAILLSQSMRARPPDEPVR
ncbi:hypothetical protein [Chryseobacterium wanjuense]